MLPPLHLYAVEYDPHGMDCADFVALVRREMFGHDVRLPNGRPRGEAGELALGELSRAYGVRVDVPEDGDYVLMTQPGNRWHVGLWFDCGGDPAVFHLRREGTTAEMTPIRDLARMMLKIEGVYRWV